MRAGAGVCRGGLGGAQPGWTFGRGLPGKIKEPYQCQRRAGGAARNWGHAGGTMTEIVDWSTGNNATIGEIT